MTIRKILTTGALLLCMAAASLSAFAARQSYTGKLLSYTVTKDGKTEDIPAMDNSQNISVVLSPKESITLEKSTYVYGGSATMLGFESGDFYTARDNKSDYEYTGVIVDTESQPGYTLVYLLLWNQTANDDSIMAAYYLSDAGSSSGGNAGSSATTTSDRSGVYNGHEAVDLGLSVMWASCNLGGSSPHDNGSSYFWNNAMEDMNWGGSWRVPSAADFSELINNCRWEWGTRGGKYGCTVTGPNGNSIFLRADGVLFEDYSSYGSDTQGWFWTSDRCDSSSAKRVVFGSNGCSRPECSGMRLYMNVRPVMNK